MNKLTKDMILAASDCSFEVVEVPEWDGTVGIKEMSGTERAQYEEALTSMVADQDEEQPKIKIALMRKALLPYVLVDSETKAPLFGAEDMDALVEKNGRVLGRLFEIAVRINGLIPERVEKN